MEDEKATSKMAERKDMLLLAQQKLDEINRGNLGLSTGRGGRPGSSSSANRRRGRKSAISSHLLSTLLYVALMAHKLEDMKTMLEEEDGEMYDEWRCLLETLHSPEFHARERIIQNRRVKNAFERKRRYKEDSTRLQQELSDTSTKLTDLQKLSNETNNEMSKTINALQDERAALLSRGEERQYEIDELNEKINELQKESETKDIQFKSLQTAVENQDKSLKEKKESIVRLEEQLSKFQQDAAVQNTRADQIQTMLDDTKARLDVCETKFASYRVEKESLIGKMQSELTDSQSLNAALTSKLEAANASLEVANRKIEENKQSLSKTLASFSDIKSRSDDLKDIVQSGMTRLDDRILQTESTLEKISNDDLQKIQTQNKQVIDSLAVVSKVSDTASSLESRFGQVHDIVSTLSSSASLEKVSCHIQEELARLKQMLDHVTAHQKSDRTSSQQEVSAIQKQLDDLLELQKSSTLNQEMSNVQSRLDDISTSERQHSSSLEQELLNVQQRLDSLSEMQKNNGIHQELSNVQARLDDISELQRSSSLQQELLNVQRRLDGLSELQQNNGLHEELTNVQSRLDDISKLQRSSSLEQGLSNVQQKLDDISERQKLSSRQSQREAIQDIARSGESVTSHQSSKQSKPVLGIADASEFEDTNSQLLQTISTSINDVCEKCSRMDHAIYESRERSEEGYDGYEEYIAANEDLLDKISSAIGDVSEECNMIKLNVQKALIEGDAKVDVRTHENEGNENTPPTSASTEDQNLSRTSTVADEIVDTFVAEAISHM